MPGDRVATILDQWAAQRPDVDPSPIAIIGRLSRLTRHLERGLEANFRRFDLKGGTFDLLASLRRQGAPFTLSPTQLQGEMMLSSGATTHRIDRLEERGLIERLPDPDDRRGTLIRLTDEGLELVDRVFVAHLETEEGLLGELSAKERKTLATILEGWTGAVGL